MQTFVVVILLKFGWDKTKFQLHLTMNMTTKWYTPGLSNKYTIQDKSLTHMKTMILCIPSYKPFPELPTCTHFVYFVHKNGNMKFVHRIEAFVHIK